MLIFHIEKKDFEDLSTVVHIAYLLSLMNSWLLEVVNRVSSKQTKINFGSNRNKPKQDLFRVCFGLFRETKNNKFWFVSVFRTYIETTETNRSVS